ncbi:MAG: patatin-like phospholipase family protein [Candidatus Acidiferrales bacterium]
MSHAPSREELARARAEFRGSMEQAGAARVFGSFAGRSAIVLSGGGARGAYEAGALLAFQDAQLPTPIVAATSVGSINAASFAAHSSSQTGNAERLIESWFGLTPPVVGIEWTRYVWMLAGLIAASAGFGNLLRHWLTTRGYIFHLHDPALTWLALGVAGVTVLLLYDCLPYTGYVLRHLFRRTDWQPDRRKAVRSILANIVVWGLLLFVLHSVYGYDLLLHYFRLHPGVPLLLIGGVLLLASLRTLWRAPLSTLFHRLLRLPARPGLFANFERGRMLRQRITHEQLRDSPIRLVFTATDLERGAPRFFTNTPADILERDPGVDARFVREETETAEDLVRAVIASSALPLVYEPIPLEGRLYTDGGIVANQPIRPAVRLGADVLFLVLVDPPEGRRADICTFLDVGLRALDLLMTQNLLTDLKILNNMNAVCARAAAERRLAPEEIEIDLGTRRYRYIQAFTIRPERAIVGTALDFGGATTGPAILQGYRDAAARLEEFLAYARRAPFGRPRQRVRFAPGAVPAD